MAHLPSNRTEIGRPAALGSSLPTSISVESTTTPGGQSPLDQQQQAKSNSGEQ
jgi:hypothetical protein